MSELANLTPQQADGCKKLIEEQKVIEPGYSIGERVLRPFAPAMPSAS